jgi:signal transduction histidine kinase
MRTGSLTPAVHAEQIRTLYRQSGIAIVNLVNSLIVAAVLWPSPQPTLLAAWVMTTIAVTLCRTALRRRYLGARPPVEQTTVWARRFVVGAVASGILWGLSGVLLYDPGKVVSQLLLMFVIGGMVAGATGTLAHHLPAFLGFAAAAILPTAARLFIEGGGLHVAMSALAISFGIAMTLVASNTHRAITEAFCLRFENQDLLAQLSRAQVSLEEVNKTLEQRVAERGAALERQTEALRDAQRMESVGLLAGGVAHDFNNLLTVVLGNVELLLDGPSLTREDRIVLDEIRSAAMRGATLVSQLLAFSRRHVMVHKVLDLNDVTRDVQPLLGRLIGGHIELAVVAHHGPLPVRADPTQLQQVIINLATNARDAMPAGGKLTIETTVSNGALAGSAIPAGHFVVLSVRDTGIGMNSETKRMIFHPFFTTKEVGRGTGLGLATVHGIVEQSAGHVLVESEPGQGTCFRVFLPWASPEDVDSLAPSQAAQPEPAARAATILIAEDEAPVRALTAQVLMAAGFSVIEAENGKDALDLARTHQGSIDLVVTDVIMAKMSGVDLANRLSKEQPTLPILLVSGYSAEQLPATNDPSRIIGFLQKPFTPTELRVKVSQLLAIPAPLARGNHAD